MRCNNCPSYPTCTIEFDDTCILKRPHVHLPVPSARGGGAGRGRVRRSPGRMSIFLGVVVGLVVSEFAAILILLVFR